VASKIGAEKVRLLAMLALTLRGTPFFYMGDEIGRERVSIPPDRVRDPFEKLVPGYGLCRDPERAPMRWDDSAKGGFTTGEPWLPLENPGARNVRQQQREPRSILQLFRALIALRREYPCLQLGDYQPLRSVNDVFAFIRRDRHSELLIALNLAAEPRKWHWGDHGRLVLSTHLDRQKQALPDASILLRGHEGAIIETKR
jgi:alpha-glucosidase